jgi:phenylacetic acid degradation operon negative regulatory protein
MPHAGVSTGAVRRHNPGKFQRNARSTLLTVIGELISVEDQPVRTASLLHVLGGLGFSEPATRQILARAADAGWLTSERVGREVHWKPTAKATALNTDVAERAAELSHQRTGVQHWDGTGIILHLTMPAERNSVRKSLYNALAAIGFGGPLPGLWVNPHVDRLDETNAIVEEFGLRECSAAFIGRLANVGLSGVELLSRGWDLKAVSRHYTKFLDTFGTLTPQPGDDVLLAYLALVHEWRQFPGIDPLLPYDLLPEWIGWRAIDLYLDRRERWRPDALRRWREVATASPARGEATAPPSEPPRTHRARFTRQPLE